MIRDRGSNFTAVFDVILAGVGIRTVLCNIRTPSMNAIAERWIGGCRREFLDRTLIWNQAPPAADPERLRGPPQSAPAAPLSQRRRAAETATRVGDLDLYRIRRQARVGGLINEYRLVA
jgi:putative transposase